MPTAFRVRSELALLNRHYVQFCWKMDSNRSNLLWGKWTVLKKSLRTNSRLENSFQSCHPFDIQLYHTLESAKQSAQRSCSRLRRVFMFVSEGRERKKGEESWRHSEKHRAKQSRTKGETSNTNCRSQWPHHTHLLSHPESRQLLAQASK